jgi:hypothetical protein
MKAVTESPVYGADSAAFGETVKTYATNAKNVEGRLNGIIA